MGVLMATRPIQLLFLILAIVCFGGVALFANDMHAANEAVRLIALGLALFAASFIP